MIVAAVDMFVIRRRGAEIGKGGARDAGRAKQKPPARTVRAAAGGVGGRRVAIQDSS